VNAISEKLTFTIGQSLTSCKGRGGWM